MMNGFDWFTGLATIDEPCPHMLTEPLGLRQFYTTPNRPEFGTRVPRILMHESLHAFQLAGSHWLQQMVAELQAGYRLVPFTGPVRFVCDGNPANEVVATYFQTEPPTLIAERGDATSFMTLQPSGSGARYQGRNETLWEHQGEATISWGYGQPKMRCQKAR